MLYIPFWICFFFFLVNITCGRFYTDISYSASPWQNQNVTDNLNLQLHSCLSCVFYQDVGLWLETINLGSYRQIFKENGVNGEYLEGMSMFTTEQILRFIRRCHMKWGDFITLCKELRRIKGLSLLPPLNSKQTNTCQKTHLKFSSLPRCFVLFPWLGKA